MTTAEAFLEQLDALGPDARMGQVFQLAKANVDMPIDEIEKLLANDRHLARVGAVGVMDFQARARTTPEAQREALFDLYIRRHDLIDTWDLVDRAAIWVVGEFLVRRHRGVLDRLAASDRPMERRTAILSTYAFIRRGDLDDALRIAGRLVGDDEDLVHKAVGWMLREVGKRDEGRLRAFLEGNAPRMPRVMLRYAIEKLAPDVRAYYLGMQQPAR
ncbi:MAG TPA: DNA alkylation repair protein [Candidatus Binatia bacterium]|nr:DNA alkylation repair protein [Candidatus Binatia bacterium]